jgi:hypothetical protein
MKTGDWITSRAEADALRAGTVIVWYDGGGGSTGLTRTKDAMGRWSLHEYDTDTLATSGLTMRPSGGWRVYSLPRPVTLLPVPEVNPRIGWGGGALTLGAIDEDWSLYKDRDGNTVYLQHGTARVLVSVDDIDDLEGWWRTFLTETMDSRPYSATHWHTRDLFKAWAKDRTHEPGAIDDCLGWCEDCSIPEWADDLNSTGSGTLVCQGCIENWSFCDRCEEYFRDVTSTLHDSCVCDHCRDNYYSYCEDCDGYYSDGDGCGGDHEEDDCCEPPALTLTIRNDGHAPLREDTRVKVQLPSGEISDEGVGQIALLLRREASRCEQDQIVADNESGTPTPYHLSEAWKYRALSNSLAELGPKWQAKDGNYTKRLSRYAYKQYSLKVSPEVISEVGNIARAHSGGVDFDIEVTRNLNLSASEFAHSDSCWWQSYSYSRCTLKSNGGFALRTFSEHGSVQGRAWVMPLKQDTHGLVPTFEVQEAAAYVVFNGYGNLEGYAAARILSHMAGMTYRKISFDVEPMYVNNESGYLVAPEEIAENYTDGAMSMSLQQHSALFHREQAALNAVTDEESDKEISHV